ncbi:MAG: M48 family metallopeptidase [Mogibacterium sp.]|nr:M48 family metallopeptidase [Mogibacterium sp.]
MITRTNAKSTHVSMVVDGIPVDLTRKRVKNMNMRIGPDGTVRVSAPFLMPERVIIEFVRSRAGWIRQHQASAQERAERLAIPEDEREALRKALRARIDRRLPYWEDRMGLRSSGYRIRDMKTRWGSCNHQTRHLNFNLKLALFDDDVLDYVIVHELAHIREANHGPAFWSIVARYLPDYKILRRRLK